MPPPPNLAELLETVNFPGMVVDESRILRAFLSKHGADYDEIRFNQRLGEGIVLANAASDKDREDWRRRTMARPDVIAWLAPDNAAIIEAKVQATNETIWQVRGYQDLYSKENPRHRVQSIIVCEGATPNAITLARAQQVWIYVYALDADRPMAPGAEAFTS